MKTLITGACALLLTGGVVYAQVQEPAPPPPPQQEAVSVSDEDIQKFVEIYVEVEKTRNELTSEMNEVTTPEEAQNIQEQMQEEIVATIADQGWSVDEYNQVANAISNDPELRNDAVELMNEMTPR